MLQKAERRAWFCQGFSQGLQEAFCEDFCQAKGTEAERRCEGCCERAKSSCQSEIQEAEAAHSSEAAESLPWWLRTVPECLMVHTIMLAAAGI